MRVFWRAFLLSTLLMLAVFLKPDIGVEASINNPVAPTVRTLFSPHGDLGINSEDCQVISVTEKVRRNDGSKLKLVIKDTTTDTVIGTKNLTVGCGGATYQVRVPLHLNPATQQAFYGRNCRPTCNVTIWETYNKREYEVVIGVQCDPVDVSMPPCVNENTRFELDDTGLHVYRDTFGDGSLVFDFDVPFPEFVISGNPWPVGLVGWETTMELSEIRSSAGTREVPYFSRTGGTAQRPQVGDMRNIKYTVSFEPFSAWPYANVEMPDGVKLPSENVVDGKQWLFGMVEFEWDRPSHPDAGGVNVSTLAQQVDLPADFPAFVNTARLPYLIRCTLTWEQYVREKDPQTGEWRNYWRPMSEGGYIPLDKINITNPTRYLAYLPDGEPDADAVWSYNVVMRSVNENGQVLKEAHTGALVWWVREAQGVIGWPSR